MCDNIKALFDNYVPPTKKFDPSKVLVSKGDGQVQFNRTWGIIQASPSLKAQYDHDGVEIYYYSRVTTYLDDTDRFIDKRVIVDGKILLDVKFSY